MLRILVADDHPSVRRYVCGVLEAEEGWEVCGEARNGREAVEMAVQLQPDLVVLDLSMPELNGLDAARQIRDKIPRAEVLILTLHEGEDLRRAARDSGAGACVVKTDLQSLVTEIRSLLQSSRQRTSSGSNDLPAAAQPTGADEALERLISRLTDREREILQLLAQSKTNREIATSLSVNLKTVETCRSTILRKLEMESIVEFVRYALRKKRMEIQQ